MARTSAQELRTCPTCGCPAEEVELGLRNYEWINPYLPGKEGAMDIDSVLEKRGSVLMMESKPWGVGLPKGQFWTYKTLAGMTGPSGKGIQVLVANGPSPRGLYTHKWLMKDGSYTPSKTVRLETLVKLILKWRQDALA